MPRYRVTIEKHYTTCYQRVLDVDGDDEAYARDVALRQVEAVIDGPEYLDRTLWHESGGYLYTQIVDSEEVA